MIQLRVQTSSRVDMIDITKIVRNAIQESGVKSGICIVFVPHTTAGLTINENADPSVKKDMIKEINKMIPFQDNYRHAEGNSTAGGQSHLRWTREYLRSTGPCS